MAEERAVRDLVIALTRVKEAVDAAKELLADIDPNTFVGSAETVTKQADTNICREPDKFPEPIHPSSAACWMIFPMKMQTVMQPLQSMSDISRMMLVGLEAVNPNTPLRRAR